MGVKKERLLVTVYRCERCEKHWLPRKPETPIDLDDLPTVCAHCKSRYWNTPRGTNKPGPKKRAE